jgi:hypothetical protein
MVYVLNDYDRCKLKPEWMPEEFAYLKAHAHETIAANDPEALGEYIGSSQVFGVPDTDPLVKRGIDYLLEHQNADGSWGDVNEKDIYTRCHTTWTGIGDWNRRRHGLWMEGRYNQPGSAPPHETLKERNDEASADRDRGLLSGDPVGRRGVSALPALLPFAGGLTELNAEALGG